MRNKISYVPFSKSIVDEVTSNVVLYSDDISEEVLKQVCQMWNTKATANAISGFLDRSPLCTQEESEYIMEQLGVYEKSLQNVEPVQENVERKLTAEEVPLVKTIVGADTNGNIITEILPKKTRTKPTPAVKSGGKVDAKDMVAKLQEQIDLIQYVDGVCAADKPVGVQISKSGREILIQLQKDIEKAKETAVQAIQQL